MSVVVIGSVCCWLFIGCCQRILSDVGCVPAWCSFSETDGVEHNMNTRTSVNEMMTQAQREIRLSQSEPAPFHTSLNPCSVLETSIYELASCCVWLSSFPLFLLVSSWDSSLYGTSWHSWNPICAVLHSFTFNYIIFVHGCHCTHASTLLCL